MSNRWWKRFKLLILSWRRPITGSRRSWWRWPSRIPREFGENDYLYRLAQQTILFLRSDGASSEEKDSTRELLRSYGIGKDLESSNQIQAIAEQLSSSAKLQQRISFRVNY